MAAKGSTTIPLTSEEHKANKLASKARKNGKKSEGMHTVGYLAGLETQEILRNSRTVVNSRLSKGSLAHTVASDMLDEIEQMDDIMPLEARIKMAEEKVMGAMRADDLHFAPKAITLGLNMVKAELRSNKRR